MRQIYRKTTMTKCGLNKGAKQLYWNRTSTWVFSYKFAAYLKNIFSWEHLWKAASEIFSKEQVISKIELVFQIVHCFE